MNNDFPTDGPDSLAEVENRPSEVALDAFVGRLEHKITSTRNGARYCMENPNNAELFEYFKGRVTAFNDTMNWINEIRQSSNAGGDAHGNR